MNLRELRRRLRADYEDKQNKESLRQDRAARLLYLNHPELKQMENNYNKMNLELLRGLMDQPGGQEEILPLLEELEKNFKQEKDNFLKEKGYKNDPREPRYSCALCRDTGTTDKGMCLCMKQSLAREIFRSEYERGPSQPSLSQMDFSIYSHEKKKEKHSQRDNILSIVESLQKFVKNFKREEGLNILFAGDVSQGKTFLAAALAVELIEEGHLVIYQTAPALIDKLRDLSWRYNEDNADLKSMIYDCDMLILDDLGKETRTDFSKKELFHLINLRYSAGKSTLISTNLKLKDIRKDYGDAFFTRLMQNCYSPEFYGPDLRIGG
ncbi:MAG TPA: ATP-binding protein [Clostridia bacterium]|nr:ATP-binding protein [Clostridia bacterium]